MIKHLQLISSSLKVSLLQRNKLQAFFLTVALCTLTITVKAMNRENVYESFVTVTAAHIPESNFIGMKKVYEDSEKDVAVYINPEYVPKIPKVGTKVSSSCGISGKVVNTDDFGFFIEQSTQVASPGDSGAKVYSEDGEYLGFVSYLSQNGLVYCVAF